uniref:Uncharacterized protein n=1 Tax=Anguilla anguilla TaxID=7936 RepID=A0A0E9VA33_ANGAN
MLLGILRRKGGQSFTMSPGPRRLLVDTSIARS